MADLSYHADGQAKPAEWFLFTCGVCDGRTLLGPEGGRFNCSCHANPTEVTVTPLYEGATHSFATYAGTENLLTEAKV